MKDQVQGMERRGKKFRLAENGAGISVCLVSASQVGINEWMKKKIIDIDEICGRAHCNDPAESSVVCRRLIALLEFDLPLVDKIGRISKISNVHNQHKWE